MLRTPVKLWEIKFSFFDAQKVIKSDKKDISKGTVDQKVKH